MGSTSSGNRSGRRGSPLRRRFTLQGPTAIYIKALTQGRTGRTVVTDDELHETLEGIIQEHARRLKIAPTGDEEGRRSTR